MTAKPFTVGYIDRPINPAFFTTMDTEPALKPAVFKLSGGEAAIAAGFATCHAYYAGGTRGELPAPWHVNASFFERFPNIMLVVAQAAGFDTVDVAACTAAGVPLINQAGGNASAVAEHAIGMMLVLLKRIPQSTAALRSGTLKDRNLFMGDELSSQTLGLVGLGHTGGRIAKLAAAFGCRVRAYDPYVDEKTMAALGVEKVSFDALLAECSIVSVHCPRNAETLRMFGADAFNKMRKGALFVTTARGGIHDETALHAALASGHLAGAGLDVWDPEPPAADHPLLALPNVVASPHLAGVTHESRSRVGRMGAEALVSACRGELVDRVVNPETVSTFLKRWQAL